MNKALMTIGVAAALLAVPAAASAAERVNDAVLGGVAGAVVGGPIGALAGAGIGYAAGPNISHGLGLKHRTHRKSAYYYRTHKRVRHYAVK